MKTDEILKLIDNKDFLEKIYNFSYHRCNTSHEADDLCSDIILAVIASVLKQERIENFYAFVWTIARRVYADFCQKRRKDRSFISFEDGELAYVSNDNEIDSLIEKADDKEQLSKIFAEISFLSKAYRDVMVMFYIDSMKIKDIATILDISETTVKQRLFSARNTVRKEVISMTDRNLSLKPIRLAISGAGNPVGNDPRTKAERLLSQNLIYLCKNKPKTAKELSEELCIPMMYIEEELEIQCRGENGTYGMLKKLDNGKYATNILLADYNEYDKANKIYEKHLSEICEKLKQSVLKYRDDMLSVPYLSPQNDTRFILWALISRMFWNFEDDIKSIIINKYFFDVTIPDRPFSCVAVAYRYNEDPDFGFYGCDGISATDIDGYKRVFVSNIYGKRVDEHFHCGHILSEDEKLRMVLKAIGGISINELTDTQKEIAAKCIDCGYLRKHGNKLEPKIIIINRKDEEKFAQIANRLCDNMEEIKESIAKELSDFMKRHIPEHLLNEYHLYPGLIAGIRILSTTIEECIKEGLLSEPENRIGAEGVIMEIEK